MQISEFCTTGDIHNTGGGAQFKDSIKYYNNLYASSSSFDQSRLDNDNDDHDDRDVTKTNDDENVNPLDPITPTTDQNEKVYPKLKGFKIGHLNIASLVKHKIIGFSG